jgi:hypothetical protein
MTFKDIRCEFDMVTPDYCECNGCDPKTGPVPLVDSDDIRKAALQDLHDAIKDTWLNRWDLPDGAWFEFARRYRPGDDHPRARGRSKKFADAGNSAFVKEALRLGKADWSRPRMVVVEHYRSARPDAQVGRGGHRVPVRGSGLASLLQHWEPEKRPQEKPKPTPFERRQKATTEEVKRCNEAWADAEPIDRVQPDVARREETLDSQGWTSHPEYGGLDGTADVDWIKRPRAELYAGKRGDGQTVTLRPGSWGVFNEDGWSERQTVCSICSEALPEPRKKFHEGDCARLGRNARDRASRAHKRFLGLRPRVRAWTEEHPREAPRRLGHPWVAGVVCGHPQGLDLLGVVLWRSRQYRQSKPVPWRDQRVVHSYLVDHEARTANTFSGNVRLYRRVRSPMGWENCWVIRAPQIHSRFSGNKGQKHVISSAREKAYTEPTRVLNRRLAGYGDGRDITVWPCKVGSPSPQGNGGSPLGRAGLHQINERIET